MSEAEGNLRSALRESMRLNGDLTKEDTAMPPQDFKADETTTVRLPRVSVDFKIPAWGLMIVAGSAILALVNMWSSQQATNEKLAQIQVTLNAVIVTNTQLLSDQQFIKFRIENLEKAAGEARAGAGHSGK
jgi:hypothetical protein